MNAFDLLKSIYVVCHGTIAYITCVSGSQRRIKCLWHRLNQSMGMCTAISAFPPCFNDLMIHNTNGKVLVILCIMSMC